MKIFGRTVVKSKTIIENLDDKLKAEMTFKLQDRIYFKGLDIAIENKKGSIRRGVDDDGTKWETFMHIPYGYVRRTESISDGEKIDCYIGDNRDSEKVFIVDQNNPFTGKFDEQKIMLGFDNAEEAKKAYLKQYDNPKFFGSMKEMTFEEFKKKALATAEKPKLLKAFGRLLKAFGTQLGMFDEVVEGQTRQKDGKTYEVRRSKKNPLVKRLFRADRGEAKPKEKKELTLFDRKVSVGGSKKSEVRSKKGEQESTIKNKITIKNNENDLFNQPEEPRKEEKKEEKKEPKAEIKVVKGKKNRKEINARVEELLKTKKNDEMSAEDVELLAQYTGRGGLGGENVEKISLIEFYTRKDEAEFIWDMIGKLGFKGGNVLEPSMGTGIFVETAPEKALVTGIEIEETSGRIGQILHGNEHDIRIQSFEQFIKDYENMGADLEGGEYDAVVGNCPFGKRGLSAMDDRAKSDIKFHEQYFIDRGLDMLKPGGIMAMIVPTSIMDNQLNQWRGEVNRKGEFLGAIRVPTGAFKHADAAVTTDIVFFKKRPPEVIDHLNNLSKEELGAMYDNMILDADFVSGNFFRNNPEYALGTETNGMFGMKIWKGDVTKADLEKVGELLNHDARDYSSLGIDISKYGELEKELEPGDVKILNGKTYILNKNHRWERLKDQEIVLQSLPEDIKKLGITSWDEWRIKNEDIGYLYGLNKDQLKLFGQTRIVNELEGYHGKNDFQDEYLTKGVVLGLAVKDLRKALQDGRLSAEEAQMQAAKLKVLLKDFVEKYGHPIENLKLNKFFKNSGNAPLLDLAGSYDKNGNTIKMFDDPLSFYKVYQTKSEIGTVDRNDIVSVVGFLFANNFPTDYQTIRGEYEGDGDIERELAYSDEIYFDEEGNYKPKEEVLYGYIYEKIDAWEKQRTELKKESKNEKLSDKEKELNAQKMRKLEDQIIEAKTRANIREIKQLPIMLSDAGSIYDIGILNKYLEEKIGAHFLGELRKDEKSGFILPVDDSSSKLYLSYADITKEGKSTEVKKELRDLFNKDEHPLLFMVLNKMNGLGLPALRTEEGIAKKEQVLQLETDFKQYLSDSEEADKIADKYNRLFNSYIQKTYDTSPIEGIKHFAYDRVVGKDASGKDITARDKAGEHTWATVRRMYEQGKGMIAHGVGLGKTLEALILTLLSKETGRANKPSIVAPKSVLLNWVAEIEKWTQGVNYLLVGYKKDATGAWVEESREEKELKLQRAANEDFDIILMSRDLFGTIDFSPETKKNMLNELMDKYYPEGNRLSTFSDKDSKYAKNVKKKRDTLLRNLSTMMDIPDPLGGVYLDNIGIDMLVRDEAHDTKNLLVPMEAEISGVNSSTSQRAMHNLFASKIIRGQNNDMGYYALTATPISNSPLEVFNMMVPFAEKELEKLQVQNMDDFVGRFADNPEQAKALLAFRNKKLQDALAEQQRQANYKQLDRLYEVKRKKAGMEDKTSKQHQMMEQEERSLTEKLIEANFEHKGKLDYDRTPVILPGINKVIPIGSILGGKDGEFYAVEDYAPSTQRVKIRTYKAGAQGDAVATRSVSAKELDKEFNALYKETELDMGGMFNKLIEDNDEIGLNFIAKIPKEILQANKVKLLEKLNNSDEVMYQTMDGDFKVADYEDAKSEITTEGGKIIFPQEKPEFPKILNELIKQNRPKQQWGQEYSRFRRFKNLAVSIYGENYENAIKKEIKRLNGEATETSFAIHTTGAQYKKELKHLFEKGYMSDYTYKQIMQGKAWYEQSSYSNALRAEFFDNYHIKEENGEYRFNPSLITAEALDRARAIDEIKSDDNKDLLEDILTNKLRGEAA